MKNVLIFLLIAGLLSGSVFSGTASIFCMTEDGHGEIEPIYSDCCSVDTHKDQPVESHDEADECSDCSDVEISNHIWVKRDNFEQITSLNTLHSVLSPLTQLQSSIIQKKLINHISKFKPDIKTIQVHISSTVLIC